MSKALARVTATLNLCKEDVVASQEGRALRKEEFLLPASPQTLGFFRKPRLKSRSSCTKLWLLRTVEMRMTLRSWPWNSSTEPTWQGGKHDLRPRAQSGTRGTSPASGSLSSKAGVEKSLGNCHSGVSRHWQERGQEDAREAETRRGESILRGRGWSVF